MGAESYGISYVDFIFFTNCFGVRIPNSEIIPVMSLWLVLSNAGLMTSIFLFCVSQTSFEGRFSIFILLVNFLETPQE